MNIDAKLAFLNRLLGKGKFSHNTKESEHFCPFCLHHKKKLSINVETDTFKCWVCNKSGRNLVFLLRKVGKKSDIDEYIKSYKAKNVIIKEEEQRQQLETFKVKLPDDFIPLVSCQDSIMGKRAFSYLSKRGVTMQDCLKYKLGLSNEKRYEDRIILPTFNQDGELTYFTSRTFVKNPLKYQDPDTPKGYKKSVVFNELYINWNKPVVLVEGFFDALKASNAIPLFGSILTTEHGIFQKIVRNCEKIYLGLDADAQQKSSKISQLLASYDKEVYHIDVSPFNDIGEMTKEDFQERYNKADLVDYNYAFRQKLRNILQ